MFKTGHLGVSLIVFGPVGYALVARGAPELAAITGFVMVWFTMLPDIDHRLPILEHRGPTHSLAFAAVVGGVGWGVGMALETVTGPAAGMSLSTVGFGIGVLTVVGHLIGDTLTPAGVPYLWPLSTRTFSLSLVGAGNPVANSGLFGLGLLTTAGWVSVALGVV